MNLNRLLRPKYLRTNPPPGRFGITLGDPLFHRGSKITCALGRYPERNELILLQSGLLAHDSYKVHARAVIEQRRGFVDCAPASFVTAVIEAFSE